MSSKEGCGGGGIAPGPGAEKSMYVVINMKIVSGEVQNNNKKEVFR